MAAPRLRFRVDVSEANYPILARFRNDPQFSRASFLAALEIGVIYLYAHDDERRRLTDLLKGQMARDFEDQVIRISAHKPAQDQQFLAEEHVVEPRTKKRMDVAPAAPPAEAVVVAPPAAPMVPIAQPKAIASPPQGEATLSAAARGMMSAYSESFKAGDEA